ncbi:hypothetical protein [uncultured Gulosibacter sp.]|uniref:hypothetical protein n=1 Tax=uncultured Gulosibacter sp. TaxID=1339167 RepID=UPI00288B48A5|nr:hypothetical protein [uncultured Gulosibacter sp.]
MSLEILHGELAEFSRALDNAAAEVSPATLSGAAGTVSTGMPGAVAGRVMQSAATTYETNLRQFVTALNSDATAASSSDADFNSTDSHGEATFDNTAWNEIDSAVNYDAKDTR